MNACTGGAPALDDLLGGVSSQPAAASTSNLADLLGGDHAPAPSTSGTASGFDDLLSHSTPSTSPQIEPFTAFEKDGIRVVFQASKPAGQEAVTDITASYSNASGQAISNFSLQVSQNKLHQNFTDMFWLLCFAKLAYNLQDLICKILLGIVACTYGHSVCSPYN